jgi:L-rhamnose-H+ transport protein
MTSSQLLGILLVALAGILVGCCAWPMKLMKKFQFEHWWFIGMLTGLVIVPWTATLLWCPNAFSAYAQVPLHTLITANLWASAWGVANVLCGLCFVRIGVALTGAILTGLGVSFGVTLPMVIKGSGLFKDAPNLGSNAGLTVLFGVAVMLVGVVFASLAGFGRDVMLKKQQNNTSGSFVGGLIMTIVAGVLSCGMSLAFVYSQGPIVTAMKANGADDIPATFAVWAVGLLGGALINLFYPVYLMIKNKSFGAIAQGGKEIVLATLIGINFAIGIVLMGKGMLMVGALGASVGFGIQQASQMLGGQGLGFISGEWRGVVGKPRMQMYIAIIILVIAAIIMAYGNSLTKS